MADFIPQKKAVYSEHSLAIHSKFSGLCSCQAAYCVLGAVSLWAWQVCDLSLWYNAINMYVISLQFSSFHTSKLFWYTYRPFKKSNATRLWSIISICLWVCIYHVRYHLKAWLFVFPLILNLSWLLCRNVRKAIKLGSMSKYKCCKIGPQL